MFKRQSTVCLTPGPKKGASLFKMLIMSGRTHQRALGTPHALGRALALVWMSASTSGQNCTELSPSWHRVWSPWLAALASVSR